MGLVLHQAHQPLPTPDEVLLGRNHHGEPSNGVFRLRRPDIVAGCGKRDSAVKEHRHNLWFWILFRLGRVGIPNSKKCSSKAKAKAFSFLAATAVVARPKVKCGD